MRLRVRHLGPDKGPNLIGFQPFARQVDEYAALVVETGCSNLSQELQDGALARNEKRRPYCMGTA
jgi:hypothetical protein